MKAVSKYYYITFVDPKGIRNLEGPSDPKIRFYQTIKKLEQRLGDPHVTLNSFVVSVTSYKQVGWWAGGMTEKNFEDHHVLFRDPEKRSHLETMFRKLLGV
jgi:hypothetical protein